MKIVYASLTGNVQRFINRLKERLPNHEFFKISKDEDFEIHDDYILITYTINFGSIPNEVQSFLEHSSTGLKGVVGSGNRNWGSNFCKASKTISNQHSVPLLHNFELSGLGEDVDTVANKIIEIERDD